MELSVKEYITKNEHETELVGEGFAAALPKGAVIAMYGDLGAGKTAFVRGMAKGMGLDCRVSSPTFTIVNEYLGERELIHFDMYRLKSPEEAFEIGIEDAFSEGVSLIEWPEKIGNLLPKKHIRVLIEPDEKGRKILKGLRASG